RLPAACGAGWPQNRFALFIGPRPVSFRRALLAANVLYVLRWIECDVSALGTPRKHNRKQGFHIIAKSASVSGCCFVPDANYEPPIEFHQRSVGDGCQIVKTALIIRTGAGSEVDEGRV